MKKYAAFALLAAMLALTITVGQAGAAPVTFSYSFSATPGTLSSGTGTVSFSIFPSSGPLTVETGEDTILLAAQVFTSSTATAPPDIYNAPFSLNLNLTDTMTGLSDVLTFAGKVVGNLTHDSSSLSVIFDEPITQSKSIGAHDYSGTVSPKVASLPAPGDAASALFDVTLRITQRLIDEEPSTPPPPPPGDDGDHDDVPSPNQVPEPSALLLGLSAAALAYWRTRRRSMPA